VYTISLKSIAFAVYTRSSKAYAINSHFMIKFWSHVTFFMHRVYY